MLAIQRGSGVFDGSLRSLVLWNQDYDIGTPRLSVIGALEFAHEQH
jgi:hypothetical protein